MQRVRFGATGLDVSRVGFGTATFAYQGMERHAAERLLNQVLDAGVNVIDTAACYPGAEPIIGSGISHRRDDYVLVSKCGHRVEGATGEPFSGELVTTTVDRALKQLRTDRIDVMLLHSCSLQQLQQGDALSAIVQAREMGKVRFVGYSGDNLALVAAVAMPEVDVIETSISVADQINIDDAVASAHRHDIGVIAKRPIVNGAWRPPSAIGELADYADGYRGRLQAMHLEPSDYGLSAATGMSDDDAWVQLALRFTLAVPGLHTAIIGTRAVAHLRRNLQIGAEGSLPRDQYQRLRQTFVDSQRASGGQWEGLT